MKNLLMYIVVLAVGLVLGSGLTYGLSKGRVETFVDVTETNCEVCGDESRSCGCKKPDNRPAIDWSKYVLKASVPPCAPQPDMSRYMLKTECPAPPDMSRYILKSAVPSCPPCISTCNKPCKIGACPPCPPPQRCPVVTCPEPKSCPPCAPVEPPRCPEPKVSCKAKYEPEDPWMVRPLMASISGM